MKNPTTGTNRASEVSGARVSDRYVYRRNLSLRGEEKWQPPRTTANMAEQLQWLEQHIAKVPVIDFHRRNMIRNAIATGAYTIDPTAIADKFLKFETELYS